MNITINHPTFNFHAAPALGRAFFAALMPTDEDPDTTAPAAAQAVAGPPQIGEYWEGQGGIYVGDFRSGAGSVYGLIVGAEEDIGRARWAPEGDMPDLTDWDGLANTAALVESCPAAKLAAGYTRDEHSDFYLPARRELHLAAANVPDKFGKESWYWSSTPYSGSYAWAVDFEHGRTLSLNRHHEFRVRPFRRFIY